MHRKNRVNAAVAAVVESIEGRVLMAVSAVSPLNGGQNVAAASNVTVTFDSAMTASTITAATLQLRDANSNLISASVTYNSATRVATLDPAVNLPTGNNFYYARVVGGLAGVKDSNGNPLTNDFNWAFNTAAPAPIESTVFSGLTSPTAVEFSPDGRVFVAEKSGLIKVFDNLNDPTPDLFADLRTSTHNHWDRGLLGLALDPQFTTGRPYVYVLYTYDAPVGGTAPTWGTVGGDSDNGPYTTGNGPASSGRLSRLTASGNAAVNETVLINDWGQQYPSHSIGHLQFGPDGYLYASAGDGASFNEVDYGQNNLLGDPTNEGGAVRAQDVRSTGDATGLDGTIIRVDPNTGLGAPGNPFTGDVNRERIIAYGLRNPFRFNFRPGSNEIWAGDVGWNNWEEINRIANVQDNVAENFGWPAYEGAGRQGGYDAANLPLLESLYAAGASAHNGPYYAWSHSTQVVGGSSEPTGSSSATGVAFYNGGTYPLSYDGAMFFADYSRKEIYVMYAGANGLPDATNRQIFKATAGGAVELQTGPNGDLFYVDLNGGRIGRFTFPTAGANNAPAAAFTTSAFTGSLPLTVTFNGGTSTDPDANDVLDFAWDLDGDGEFDDSTAVAPSWTYTTAGTRTVTLRVTDRGGLSSIATQTITAGSSAPIPTILTPNVNFHWKVGDTISFTGSATDPEDGALAASRLRWDLVLVHAGENDPTNSHTHTIQSFNGVAGGSFVAPDHEYPSWLEIRLTATDSSGLSTMIAQRIDPQTAALNFTSSPSGLQISVGGSTFTTPFARTVIAGSTNTITAPAQGNGTGYYTFTSWSDGAAATHNVIAPAGGATYNATFANTALGSGLTAAYYDNIDFTGTTFTRTDSTVNFNWGAGSPDPRIGADTFSARWTGQILAPVTGLYQFLTTTDDGVRLWVNDVLLVDKFIDQPPTEWSGNIPLTAGQKYDIRMDYFEDAGGAQAELRWVMPGGVRDIVPQQFLFGSAAPASVPDAPTGLAGVVVTPNRVDLTWNDNSDDESNFMIERRYAGWIWEPLATVTSNVRAHSDATAIGGVTYEYRVRAVNAAGASPWNDNVIVNTANVSSGGVPVPASGLAAVPLSTTRVRLTWVDNANNETGFKIQRRVGTSGAWITLTTAAANSITYDDATAAANTSYQYQVVATNNTGDAGPSNIASATTASSGTPIAPTTLAGTVLNNGSVRLNWADASTNETGFQVERRFAGWIWETIATVGANVTTYTDAGAIRNVQYEYRVAATSVAGLSGYSNGAIVNTPAAPTNFVGAANVESIRFSWDDNATNERGYAVQVQPAGTKKWATISTLPAGATSFTAPLAENKALFRVFALGDLKDSGSITAAAPSKAEALARAVAPPTHLLAEATSTKLKLTWQDNATAETGYAVQRLPAGEKKWITVAVLPADATTYTEKLRTNKNKYRVFALGQIRDSDSLAVSVPSQNSIIGSANKSLLSASPSASIWSQLAV